MEEVNHLPYLPLSVLVPLEVVAVKADKWMLQPGWKASNL
jgi:hypothetical protein